MLAAQEAGGTAADWGDAAGVGPTGQELVLCNLRAPGRRSPKVSEGVRQGPGVPGERGSRRSGGLGARGGGRLGRLKGQRSEACPRAREEDA